MAEARYDNNMNRVAAAIPGKTLHAVYDCKGENRSWGSRTSVSRDAMRAIKRQFSITYNRVLFGWLRRRGIIFKPVL